jgi:nitroimidazol reductase NimA-like FMN-containing flavoprotein (pyridoxamine 5'-phosphate oxidase superfamily)
MDVQGRREIRELSYPDSLRLLATVRFGRVVFTRHTRPMIRPVNHLVDGDQLIIYANLNLVPVQAGRQVVAYEADTISHATQLGWCVILTGTAEPIDEPLELRRYEQLIDPWLPGSRSRLVRIEPDLITGIELVQRW